MKKKVIFVTKALWIGGIETALVNLLNNMDYEKYEVTLLILRAELDLLEQINSNCRVIIADRIKRYSFESEYKYNWLFNMTEKSDNPSLLHQIMMWTSPIIKWIENRLYIKYIRENMKNEKYDAAIIYSDVVAEITIRSINAEKYFMFYHHGAMRRVYHDEIAYKKCENIIAVSEKLSSDLKSFVPRAQNKIVTINNLIDIDGVREKALDPIEEVWDHNMFNIVSVGRISYEKGMDIALEVCSNLVNEGFNKFSWWIVGDGPEMEQLQKLVVDRKLENNIKLVGMKKNPYPYIGKADLYVQPSREEAYGLTIMEAIILGKKVVATDTMGANEINDEYKCITICSHGIEAISYEISKEIHNKSSSKLEILDSILYKHNENVIKKLEKIL
ncbi:MAG: glycosyltransferase [Lachnospiraceae bacterium]|nr:glycosyltransferase [Lachnospiraceae bacterium]